MLIKTKDTIFSTKICQVQIEITGICNMNCKHCRNSFDKSPDMPLSEIDKILKFAIKNGNEQLEVVLSGGEPFLHKNFNEILVLLKKHKIKNLYITTNGSQSITPYLQQLKKFKTMISVSIDSIVENEHDLFRNFKGAFKKALETIKYLYDNEVFVGVRTSLLPENIDKIGEIADFVYQLGVKRLAISSVLPIGSALNDENMLMTQNEKRKFLETLFAIREKYYPEMKVTTNDPLHNLCQKDGCCDEFTSSDGVHTINGCTGGVTQFNVFANGDLTPCAIFNMPILNVFKTEYKDIEKIYVRNEVVKNLVSRAFSGKCGKCPMKFTCGGCRARAKNTYGDYLATDPDCWI